MGGASNSELISGFQTVGTQRGRMDEGTSEFRCRNHLLQVVFIRQVAAPDCENPVLVAETQARVDGNILFVGRFSICHPYLYYQN